jgi:hypothetical protein
MASKNMGCFAHPAKIDKNCFQP